MATKTAPVRMKDKKTGTVFYVTGPLSEIFKAQRVGLGLTREELAEKASVCVATIFRRENDKNMKGSWGYLRTNVKMLNALGLQLMGVEGA